MHSEKDVDLTNMLSPSKRQSRELPPYPDVFQHRHPESHVNNILLREQGIEGRQAAFRVFLEVFMLNGDMNALGDSFNGAKV